MRSLGPLDKRIGVRVTAVAPGVIKTPLWTEHPEKFKLITDADEWVTPEFVAEIMTDLVEKDVVELAGGAGGSRLSTGDSREATKKVAVEGGMILEVVKGRVRAVEQFNDSGPSGEGATVGNMGLADEEIFASLEGGGWGVNKVRSSL